MIPSMTSVKPKELVDRGVLDDAVDTILKGVERMFKKRDKRFDNVEDKLDKVDGKIGKLEIEHTHLKDKIDGLKADLSTTPTKTEFNNLKARVDKYHPLSD
jgi:predicted  nucleic acid-binding Zn-ribbon protein